MYSGVLQFIFLIQDICNRHFLHLKYARLLILTDRSLLAVVDFANFAVMHFYLAIE